MRAMQAIDKPLVSVWFQQHAARGLIRIFDYAVAGALIALTLPLTAFVALAIKLESEGPVFTQEQRLTRSGRRVLIFRFRSNRRCRGSAGLWRQEVTQIGKVIAYTRISNLPQLLNVLRGDSSLVDSRARRLDFFD
jgi:polysaccharide biosynthesis protein PslA